MIGQFSFDENTAPAIINESGTGPTNHIQDLTVSFYDSGMNLLGTYDNVVMGTSVYGFFNLNFNTVTEQLEPGLLFDVGEDTGDPSEYYLFSLDGQNFELYNVGTGVVDTGIQFNIQNADVIFKSGFD